MRKVRVEEVAADAGVSRATVDRVLNRRGGVSFERSTVLRMRARSASIATSMPRRSSCCGSVS